MRPLPMIHWTSLSQTNSQASTLTFGVNEPLTSLHSGPYRIEWRPTLCTYIELNGRRLYSSSRSFFQVLVHGRQYRF